MTEKSKKTEQNTEITEAPAVADKGDDKIGGILKQARLSKGKKIPEVAQTLCIRKAYLEAIEANDYEKIPEFPYGIGFIRSYADYLGLNSSLIIQKYKEESEPETAGNENGGYQPEPQAEAAVPNRKYLTISLLAIIAVYAAWYFYNSYKSLPLADVSEAEKETVSDEIPVDEAQYPLVVEDFAMNAEDAEMAQPAEEPLPVIEPAPVEDNAQVNVTEASFVEPAAQTEPEKENKPAETEVAPAENKAVAEPVAEVKPAAAGKSNIVFQIKKETWIEVKTADKLYLSKVLYAGDSYALPKAKGLIVSVGRFDGVETLIDGQVVDFLPKDRKMNINLEEALEKVNRKL